MLSWQTIADEKDSESSASRPASFNPPFSAPDSSLNNGGRYTDLSRRSVRAGAVQLSAQLAQVLLLVLSGMLLARVLTPADFGFFAMVTSLTAFFTSFRDFGFPMATVQKEVVGHRDVSALFWLSLKLNVLVAVVIMVLAPALAWFYDEDRLIPLTLVMGVAVFIYSLRFQPESLLIREMRFGTLKVIETAALFAGIMVGVGSALFGADYWALFLQVGTDAAVRTSGIWAACGWRPASYKSSSKGTSAGVREMIRYSFPLTGTNILDYIGKHLDRILIGFLSGAASVGLYSNAYRWAFYPIIQIHAPLTSVAVSSLSRLRAEPHAFSDACRRGLLAYFSVVVPALSFMFVESRNVILILLGPQWVEAIPIFQILCIAGIARALDSVTKWVYLSTGRTGRQFRWSLLYTPAMVIAVIVGVKWGAYGVAIALAATAVLLAIPSVAYCIAGSPLRSRDFLSAAARPLFASVAAAVLLMLFDIGGATSALPIVLLLQCLIFGATFFVTWLLLPGGRKSFGEMLAMLAMLPWPLRLRRREKRC